MACTTGQPVDPHQTSTVTVSSPAPQRTPDPDESYLGDYEGFDETYAGPQTPSAESQTRALELAAQGVAAYYNTRGGSAAWLDRLDGILSARGRAAYATVDPARIEAATVTGDPEVVRFDGGSGITVAVPTTGGDVQVDLIIETDGGPWRIDRFHFPEATP